MSTKKYDEYKRLVLDLREAADKWKKDNPVTFTGGIRYDFALRDAATAIEDLNEELEMKYIELMKTN